MKTCTHCNIEKPLFEFSQHKYTQDKKASWCKNCKNEQNRNRRDIQYRTKEGHIKKILAQRKSEAKKHNLPFEVDLDYLCKIATDNCPVLNFPLSWGERKGHATENSPSLDKFDPAKGYVRGNVCWISFKANTIKSNATMEECQMVVEWMKKHK